MAAVAVAQDRIASVPVPSYGDQNSTSHPQSPRLSMDPKSPSALPQTTDSSCQQEILPPRTTSPQFGSSCTNYNQEPMHTAYSASPVQLHQAHSEPGPGRPPYDESRSDVGQSQQENLRSVYSPLSPSSPQASPPISPIGRASPNLVLQKVIVQEYPSLRVGRNSASHQLHGCSHAPISPSVAKLLSEFLEKAQCFSCLTF